MFITAALSWYDEKPEDLILCVKALGKIADRVVALDGAYRRYPSAKPRSPDDQVAAIRDAARAANIDSVILQPDRTWAGQVEKRSFLLANASVGSDWISIVDTDHIVHTGRKKARAELASYGPDIDVVSVGFFTPSEEDHDLKKVSATNWHKDMAGTTVELGHFFRALPGLHVERFHWWYAAVKDGHKVWLWHGDGQADAPVLSQHRMKEHYVVEHRCLYRDERHILENRAFCNDRIKVVEKTGQEDDVPGLHPPVYDYNTIPY